MPQQDTYRPNQRKPGPPPSRPQDRAQPQRPPYKTPQERLLDELSFSISLQMLRESVEQGCKVTFHQFGHDDVTGYLAGMDREYFFVYVPDPAYTERTEDPYEGFVERGVSRGLNTGFTIHRQNTFEDELAHPKMAPRVDDFRHWYVRSASKSPSGPVRQGPPRNGRPHGGDVPRNWQKQPGTDTVGPSHPHFSEVRR